MEPNFFVYDQNKEVLRKHIDSEFLKIMCENFELFKIQMQELNCISVNTEMIPLHLISTILIMGVTNPKDKLSENLEHSITVELLNILNNLMYKKDKLFKLLKILRDNDKVNGIKFGHSELRDYVFNEELYRKDKYGL